MVKVIIGTAGIRAQNLAATLLNVKYKDETVARSLADRWLRYLLLKLSILNYTVCICHGAHEGEIL